MFLLALDFRTEVEKKHQIPAEFSEAEPDFEDSSCIGKSDNFKLRFPRHFLLEPKPVHFVKEPVWSPTSSNEHEVTQETTLSLTCSSCTLSIILNHSCILLSCPPMCQAIPVKQELGPFEFVRLVHLLGFVFFVWCIEMQIDGP